MGTGFVPTVHFWHRWPHPGALHGGTWQLCWAQYAAEDAWARRRWSRSSARRGALMAAAILISTFGCATTRGGARVYYAMAATGCSSSRCAGILAITRRWRGCWCNIVDRVLCVSGFIPQLLDYIIFAALCSTSLPLWGYLFCGEMAACHGRIVASDPVLPGLYIVMATWICIVLLRYKPQYTWPGLVLVLIGIPVYFLWSRKPSIQT
jgi:APA family basic amino acid/polyamine antiporter